MKTATIYVGVFVLFIAVIWALAFNGLAMKSWFAPRSVAIDNRVFHESQQFNDGMARDLDDARQAYVDPNATPESKAAIRATIIHRFAGYDASKLAPDQQTFLITLRGY